MSKVAITGNASGTGTFTIASPNSNSDRTLNLPDNSGTVLTSASNLAGVTGVGKVLQVVQTVLGGNTSTTSATRSDTGLTASITPTSVTSKVLVLVNMAGCNKNGGVTSGSYLGLWLMRGATTVIKFEGEGGYTATTAVNSFGSCSTAYLDSPATTAATTYKVQFNNEANAGFVSFNNSSSSSTITLMEIAA
jgi:hypothetical protein